MLKYRSDNDRRCFILKWIKLNKISENVDHVGTCKKKQKTNQLHFILLNFYIVCLYENKTK